MILADLLSLARNQLSDEIEPYLWSDADLVRWFNEAVDEACIRARLKQDSESDLCAIALEAGVGSYELDPAIFVVKSLWLSTSECAVKIITRGDLERAYPKWRTETGLPTCAAFDLDTKKLRVYPIPTEDEAQTLYQTVWRKTTEDERLAPEALQDEPAIPEEYHEGLIDWVLFRAYSRKDESETMDLGKSKAHEGDFERRFGPRPTAADLQQMAVNRKRETIPHFF
jgi:hypothetical protein